MLCCQYIIVVAIVLFSFFRSRQSRHSRTDNERDQPETQDREANQSNTFERRNRDASSRDSSHRKSRWERENEQQDVSVESSTRSNTETAPTEDSERFRDSQAPGDFPASPIINPDRHISPDRSEKRYNNDFVNEEEKSLPVSQDAPGEKLDVDEKEVGDSEERYDQKGVGFLLKMMGN